jgi:hypothetical protein
MPPRTVEEVAAHRAVTAQRAGRPTATAPAMLALLWLASPASSVPPDTVVPPVKVFTPLKISVPVPALVKLPSPVTLPS